MTFYIFISNLQDEKKIIEICNTSNLLKFKLKGFKVALLMIEKFILEPEISIRKVPGSVILYSGGTGAVNKSGIRILCFKNGFDTKLYKKYGVHISLYQIF